MSVGTMVKQVITSWIDGRVLFECEVSADIAEGLRLKAALEIGVKARADLDGANLTRANLYGANLYGANLERANLERANLGDTKLIDGGLRSDGYRFWLIHSTEEGWRIKAGCRNFTLAEARTHWSQPRENMQLHAQALLIVDHLLALAKLRGWDVV